MAILRTATIAQNQSMLNRLMANQNKLLQVSAQVDSQKKVNTLSDNPVEIATIMNLNKQLADIAGYYKNITSAENQLTVLDETFNTTNSRLNRINDLTLSTLNGTGSKETNAAAKNEIDQLIESVVDMANKSYNGTYIFSGAKTSTPAYSVEKDANGQITGIVYNGSKNGSEGSQRKLEISNGVKIDINVTGDSVFGSYDSATGTGSGLFQALGELSVAFSPDPPDYDAMRDAFGKFQDQMKHVNAKRSEFGTKGTKVEMTKSSLQDFELTTKGHKSALVDLDYSEAITALMQQNTAYQASMQVFGLLSKNSLLNYI